MNAAQGHFDLTSIAMLTVVALSCGIFLQSLRQPPIVGYILAGVALGPSGFKLVRDAHAIELFAELGVLLLLFLIGMEVSLRALRSVFMTALLCALLQVAIAVGLSLVISTLLSWPFQRGLILGFVLALSSTAIGIKILEDIGELRSEVGRITIGVLITQDLLMVPMLVIINSLGAKDPIGAELVLKVGGSSALLVALLAYLSRRKRLQLRFLSRIRRDPDLGPLAMLAFCFVLATLAGLAGLTPSYGAFVAGLVIGSSIYRKAAIHTLLPIQSILLMIFFLSIGLLVDISFVFENFFNIFILVVLLFSLKTFVNVTVLNVLGQSWKNAVLSGAVMGQVGEFSFVLSAAAFSAGVIANEGYQLALSVIALSLIASPFWLSTARRLEAFGTLRTKGMRVTFQDLYSVELSRVFQVSKAVRSLIKRLRSLTRK